MLRIVCCCIVTRFLITSQSRIGKRVLTVHRFGPKGVAQSFAKLGRLHTLVLEKCTHTARRMHSEIDAQRLTQQQFYIFRAILSLTLVSYHY